MWLLYTFITFAVLGIAILCLYFFARKETTAHEWAVINRMKTSCRVAANKSGRHPPSVFVMPFFEKIIHRVDGRSRRIVFRIEVDDVEFKIKIQVEAVYKVIAKQAFLAAQNRPNPVEKIVDFCREKVPLISSFLDKSHVKIFQCTLLSELDEQLAAYLPSLGYQLLSVKILESFSAPKASFDLTKTNQVMALLSDAQSSRDKAWWETFNELIIDANFAYIEDQIEAVSPSLRAFVVIPPKDDCFNPITMREVFDICLNKGVGLAVKISLDAEGPLFVLSYIEIYAITVHKFDEIILQSDIPEGPFYQQQVEYIPMGEPSAELLPMQIRRGVDAYLKQLNIEDPQVTLIADAGDGDFMMRIAFNVFHEQFNSDSDFEAFTRQFYWYLPRTVSVSGLSNANPMVEHMVPLLEKSAESV